MTQHTTADKARIFWLYPGCEILTPNCEGWYDKLIGIKQHPSGGWSVRGEHGMVWRDIDKVQLALTPLSDITDEDAIEVIKIQYPKYSDLYPNGYTIRRQNIKYQGVYLDYEHEDGFLDCLIRLYHTKLSMFRGGITYPLNYKCIDFLRSRGYALPYNGIDLFQSGIAIAKRKEGENG